MFLPCNLSVSIPEIKNIAATSGPHVDGRGDLRAELQVAFYVDMDGDGMWSAGDVGLAADCSTYMAQSLQYAPLDKYGAVTWLNAVVMEGGRQCTLILLWRIPIAAGNEIQGDSVSFDIKFNLAQYLQ